MDVKQEEMQFIGLFGIFREAYKIIFTWRKIFSQITLSFIFPLTFMFLSLIEISNILHDESDFENSRSGTANYDKLSNLVSSEAVYFWLFKAAYFIFLLIFSLLSTSAVVYTIACIYTGQEVSFSRIISVVPRVWKRLMITSLSTFICFFVYHIIAFVIIILITVAAFWLSDNNSIDFYLPICIIVIMGLYLVGFVYLTVIWQLASVVSVLEEACGFKAMKKSKELLKGKMGVGTMVFFMLCMSVGIAHFAFLKLVVHGVRFGTMNRVVYGVICFLVLLKFILFQLVVHTVLYFVCKSYHHENIDKSALSDHLEVYFLGEYLPLKSKDVQLEKFEV